MVETVIAPCFIKMTLSCIPMSLKFGRDFANRITASQHGHKMAWKSRKK